MSKSTFSPGFLKIVKGVTDCEEVRYPSRFSLCDSLSTVCMVFTFSQYDVYGFNWVDQSRGTQAYRIVQTEFQWIGLTPVVLLAGYLWPFLGEYRVALASNVVWLTLGCDLLFKWALREKLEKWTWFDISPIVLFHKVFTQRDLPWSARGASPTEVVIQAVIGVSLAVYLLL